jgi:hypothetical protein
MAKENDELPIDASALERLADRFAKSFAEQMMALQGSHKSAAEQVSEASEHARVNSIEALKREMAEQEAALAASPEAKTHPRIYEVARRFGWSLAEFRAAIARNGQVKLVDGAP